MESTAPASDERSIGRLEGSLQSLTVTVDGIAKDVSGLRSDFRTMEAGRLSRLEVQFATMHAEVSIKARNTAVLTGIVASISASVISGGILYLLFHFTTTP